MNPKYLAEALIFGYLGYKCLSFALRTASEMNRDARPARGRRYYKPGARRVAIGIDADDRRLRAFCPGCGAELGASGEPLGMLTRCPSCARAITVQVSASGVAIEVKEG